MTGPPLTADQIAVLTRWIDQGAQWPDVVANEQNAGIQKHWAYVKPVRPAIPAVRDARVGSQSHRQFRARAARKGRAPSDAAKPAARC